MLSSFSSPHCSASRCRDRFFSRPLSCGLLLTLLLLGMTGCNPGVKKMPLPQEEFVPPREVELEEGVSPLRFEALIFDIPGGRPVGTLYAGLTEDGSKYCNYGTDAVLTAASSATFVGAAGHGDINRSFVRALRTLGYNVVGDQADTFTIATERNKARFAVIGRITDMVTNICNECSLWDCRSLGTASGETYLEIEWSVGEIKPQLEVLKIQTRGFAKIEKGVPAGAHIAYITAFEDAVFKLGSSPEFYRIISTPEESNDSIEVREGGYSFCLNHEPLGPFMQETELITQSVVTVVTKAGHGSGYAITEDGYFLTNYHVVKGQSDVRIEPDLGFQIPAEVVAYNQIRDVALLKVNARFPPAAIARNPVKITDEVFPVGAPINRSMGKTVTKGVVSAFRDSSKQWRDLIQSDASIQPGNSGGPVFNAEGEVVAMTVSMLTLSSEMKDIHSLGVNFFIPIHDALNALGIKDRCDPVK